ncbi:HAMP domain-containing sensor histidine kinase [Bacillus sp. ISL-45]|uniref:sensor histidine kinase n=1 Tax=Bacillus sp. ISL-45 TaxID=2819128 RepID=UPI002035334F|nr:HAMP domain-containing sensor histidine kinase [Bacillus sp. ISL-45]
MIDYIKQDVLTRGNNHARILDENFDRTTIGHVVEMEQGVTTEVLIADSENNIIAASKEPDNDMKKHLTENREKSSYILEDDWRDHRYIISVSTIGDQGGYVYMYYPSNILREIVFVMNALITIASIGIILLAFGLIGILSKKLTSPLLTMKEATSKMALGKYRQTIPVKGEDEVAQLGISIQKLGEQLQYFEDSRNEFLAAVSHELRTPLTYIKGYSDVLKKGMANSDEEKEEYLSIINKEAQRLSIMINDLFEMSKLQVGKFELDKRPVNLNELINKIATNLRPEVVKKGLKITLELEDGLPETKVDKERMEQVFYNLLENAVKYSTEGEITIRSFTKKDLVVVEICDTGEGIPKPELSRIWDRFYRVERSRGRKTGGTGLGLYVVKQIIEAHGGQIQVNSRLNEGTVFTIYLKTSKERVK